MKRFRKLVITPPGESLWRGLIDRPNIHPNDPVYEFEMRKWDDPAPMFYGVESGRYIAERLAKLADCDWATEEGFAELISCPVAALEEKLKTDFVQHHVRKVAAGEEVIPRHSIVLFSTGMSSTVRIFSIRPGTEWHAEAEACLEVQDLEELYTRTAPAAELVTRSANFEPSSFNAEKRTVTVVASTGADVVRRDYQGEFIERLAINEAEVPENVPLLDSHNRFELDAILGAVDRTWTEGGRLLASLRFADTPKGNAALAMVQQGILRGVSIGYGIKSKKVETNPTTGARIVTIAPRVQEISMVAIPADPGATVRSQMNPVQQFVHNTAAALRIPAAFADTLLQRADLTEDQARTELLAEAQRLSPVVTNRGPAHMMREASPQDFARAAGEAIYQRINPSHQLSEIARPFAHRRMVDMVRMELQRQGHSTLGSDAEIWQRGMHTLSDFTSGIFAELFNKSLLTLGQAPLAIGRIFKNATADDFRAKHLFEISDGGALEKVNESGEIKSSTISDKKLSSYKIDTYGRMFSISFQALVNDDMGALADISGKMTRGAQSWRNGFLVSVVIANPALADNVALFHASHGNLAGSGAAPSDVTIGAGKLAMRKQKDASGNIADVVPKYIVIPAALEGAIDKLFATLYPQTSSAVENAIKGLEPIVEPRLDASSATGWYLFADPSNAPVFEVSELSGYQGPQVEVRQGWNTLGTEVRILWHLGAGAVDSRGAWKNAGA